MGRTTFDDRIDSDLLVRLVELSLEHGATKAKQLAAARYGVQLSRESFYGPVLRLARKRGVFDVLAPAHTQLEAELRRRYGSDARRIDVVSAPFDDGREYVARKAARVALEQMRELGRDGRRVRVGLGGGHMVMEVAQELAKLLRAEPTPPPLALHALSSGFDVHHPETAPVMFFGFFMPLEADIEYVGLFAPAAVRTAEYEATKRQMGVAESFRAAAGIDIVITSLASARDAHGSLRRFFKVGARGLRVRALEKAGWRADLQYAPYSESGPIDVDAGMRAVTLFELRDLRRLASRPDKRVIVVAAPCHGCRQLKTEAVRPLLEKPELALWTHLVTDQRTAAELVKPAA